MTQLDQRFIQNKQQSSEIEKELSKNKEQLQHMK
jgi:hypothetical protein